LVDTRTTTYSDAAHLGIARYLQVVIERSSQSAQVVLVGNSPTAEPLTECLNLIRDRLGTDLHSLWFNANTQPVNTILGPTFQHWYGPETVTENFGEAAIHYPPGAFGQSNLEVAQKIIEYVRAEIPAGARVAEFYAGVGAIGLSVVARTSELRLNEVGTQSLQGLQKGLDALGAARPSDRAKVTVIPGTAGATREIAAGAEVVIADPPRKGLDPELTTLLATQPPERFIYVSCGLDSFLADAQRLTSGGKLRLAALTAFNLMPFTDHVETVARFDRA
jgi:23S rRNA (uracil1939-C5)-methyltransferase